MVMRFSGLVEHTGSITLVAQKKNPLVHDAEAKVKTDNPWVEQLKKEIDPRQQLEIERSIIAAEKKRLPQAKSRDLLLLGQIGKQYREILEIEEDFDDLDKDGLKIPYHNIIRGLKHDDENTSLFTENLKDVFAALVDEYNSLIGKANKTKENEDRITKLSAYFRKLLETEGLANKDNFAAFKTALETSPLQPLTDAPEPLLTFAKETLSTALIGVEIRRLIERYNTLQADHATATQTKQFEQIKNNLKEALKGTHDAADFDTRVFVNAIDTEGEITQAILDNLHINDNLDRFNLSNFIIDFSNLDLDANKPHYLVHEKAYNNMLNRMADEVAEFNKTKLSEVEDELDEAYNDIKEQINPANELDQKISELQAILDIYNSYAIDKSILDNFAFIPALDNQTADDYFTTLLAEYGAAPGGKRISIKNPADRKDKYLKEIQAAFRWKLESLQRAFVESKNTDPIEQGINRFPDLRDLRSTLVNGYSDAIDLGKKFLSREKDIKTNTAIERVATKDKIEATKVQLDTELLAAPWDEVFKASKERMKSEFQIKQANHKSALAETLKQLKPEQQEQFEAADGDKQKAVVRHLHNSHLAELVTETQKSVSQNLEKRYGKYSQRLDASPKEAYTHLSTSMTTLNTTLKSHLNNKVALLAEVYRDARVQVYANPSAVSSYDLDLHTLYALTSDPKYIDAETVQKIYLGLFGEAAVSSDIKTDRENLIKQALLTQIQTAGQISFHVAYQQHLQTMISEKQAEIQQLEKQRDADADVRIAGLLLTKDEKNSLLTRATTELTNAETALSLLQQTYHSKDAEVTAAQGLATTAEREFNAAKVAANREVVTEREYFTELKRRINYAVSRAHFHNNAIDQDVLRDGVGEVDVAHFDANGKFPSIIDEDVGNPAKALEWQAEAQRLIAEFQLHAGQRIIDLDARADIPELNRIQQDNVQRAEQELNRLKGLLAYAQAQIRAVNPAADVAAFDAAIGGVPAPADAPEAGAYNLPALPADEPGWQAAAQAMLIRVQHQEIKHDQAQTKLLVSQALISNRNTTEATNARVQAELAQKSRELAQAKAAVEAQQIVVIQAETVKTARKTETKEAKLAHEQAVDAKAAAVAKIPTLQAEVAQLNADKATAQRNYTRDAVKTAVNNFATQRQEQVYRMVTWGANQRGCANAVYNCSLKDKKNFGMSDAEQTTLGAGARKLSSDAIANNFPKILGDGKADAVQFSHGTSRDLWFFSGYRSPTVNSVYTDNGNDKTMTFPFVKNEKLQSLAERVANVVTVFIERGGLRNNTLNLMGIFDGTKNGLRAAAVIQAFVKANYPNVVLEGLYESDLDPALKAERDLAKKYYQHEKLKRAVSTLDTLKASHGTTDDVEDKAVIAETHDTLLSASRGLR